MAQKKGRKRRNAEAAVLQVKVTLRNLTPPVWRRLLVPGDFTLGEFHRILQTAMGWSACHLHVFTARSIRFGPLDPQQDEDQEDEDAVLLSEVLLAPKDRLLYEYDFGDGWEHSAGTPATLSRRARPRCLTSAGRQILPAPAAARPPLLAACGGGAFGARSREICERGGDFEGE